VLNAQGRSWLTAVGRLLDIFASLGIVVATGLIAWHMLGSSAAVSRALPIPSEPVSLDQAERLGRSEAKVVLIVFSDFQCPYCSEFSNSVLPSLRQAYVETGLVQVAFRHMPLANIHSRAFPAAIAAECAARQGRFWPMHDELFTDPVALEDGDLLVLSVNLEA
jgi:protein-disulfide isomerase